MNLRLDADNLPPQVERLFAPTDPALMTCRPASKW